MSCDNKQCTPPTDYEINLSIVRPTTEKATDKAQQPAAPKKVTPTQKSIQKRIRLIIKQQLAAQKAQLKLLNQHKQKSQSKQK